MIIQDGEFVDRAPSVEPPDAVDGVFSTIGCQYGKPMLWNRHRRRLQNSLAELFPDIQTVLPGQEQLEKLLRITGYGNATARIRVVVWCGSEGVLRVEASAAAVALPWGGARDPVSLKIVQWGLPPNPSHKWIAREQWSDARHAAHQQGCYDALLVDGSRRVLETSIANVVYRRGPTLFTPPAPDLCLPGIMREWVMENSDVAEQEFDLESLLSADEVWLTNAVAGIVRVGVIGSRVWRRWRGFDTIIRSGVPAPGWPSSPSSLES